MADYSLVDTPEGVEALAERLARERVIALDTEADSFYHYFDKLCLLQVAYGGKIALIDPLALPEKGLEPLRAVLADEKVRKILHAADYDIYVLLRHSKLRVRNIIDTMISAQLLGYPAVGLAAIVERHFGVQLSKDQQRTDWSRRPLRTAQIEYAASDVRYLIELAGKLETELRSKKRLDWAVAEFAALEQKVWPEREFDSDGHLRIKGSKQLSARGLAILRELFLMRDQRAREGDRPPFKVLGNGTLLELAKNPPRSKRSLYGRKGVTDLVVRRLGPEILEAVGRGMKAPEIAGAEKRRGPGSRRRLDRRAEDRLDRLKRWRARRARELDLDPGVFCPNATLEEIAWANPDSVQALERLGSVKPWWATSFAEEVLSALELAAAPRSDGAAADAHTGRSAARSGRRRRGDRR